LMGKDRVLSSLEMTKLFQLSNGGANSSSKMRVSNGCGVEARRLDVVARSGSHLSDEILLLRGGVEENPGPQGKAPTTKRGPKPKKTFKKGSKAPIKKGKQSGYKTEICKTLGFPASRLCPLRYVIPQQQLTGGGVLNNLRFTSNHYDVDSALGLPPWLTIVS